MQSRYPPAVSVVMIAIAAPSSAHVMVRAHDRADPSERQWFASSLLKLFLPRSCRGLSVEVSRAKVSILLRELKTHSPSRPWQDCRANQPQILIATRPMVKSIGKTLMVPKGICAAELSVIEFERQPTVPTSAKIRIGLHLYAQSNRVIRLRRNISLRIAIGHRRTRMEAYPAYAFRKRSPSFVSAKNASACFPDLSANFVPPGITAK
jgi:hypothetical protein